jgi:ATP-dependent Zn protease
MQDFEEAIDRVVAGLEKKNRVINPQERQIVAVHETGHALVAAFTASADKVHKISIIPRGIGALGLMTFPRQRHPMFLGEQSGYTPGESREYSEATAEAIDAETKKVLDERLEHVKQLLQDKRALLDRIAALLLEKEVLEGEEFARILQGELQPVS